MKPIRVHIVHEYGSDFRPNSSSYIRLLRPLTHPTISDRVQVTFGPRYNGEKVDAVIVDRLWRPDISPDLARQLLDVIHQSAAKFIYSIDDNLIDLALEREDWPKEIHLNSLDMFLKEADEVWVSTIPLMERFASLNSHITVIPNALDERLLNVRGLPFTSNFFNKERLVIGYMGTQSHDKDLLMVMPALQMIERNHPDQIQFQVIGGITQTSILDEFKSVPIRFFDPGPDGKEYPLFMIWFCNNFNWDIAISPLADNTFNRCKSDIKFLDYSAIGTPTIASNVSAYSSSIQQGETGTLVDNSVEAWTDALEKMLDTPVLRRQMGNNANFQLYNQRNLKSCARVWLEALEKAL